jgi:hypothetical protein
VAIAKQLVNKAVSGDNKFVKLILEMIGPSSERGRQEELEASHREGADARERVARKLQQMSERLNAGLPLVPEETEEPETSENAKDAKRR